MAEKSTIDLIVGAFDLNQRRKFTLKKADGTPLVDLYFKPITRSDRTRVQALAGNGDKAFGSGDAIRLQREIPESVLNELELFLFNVSEDGIPLEEAKND